MGEQANKETVLEKGFGRLNPSFIYVHDIGNFLEGVERNARRQNDANQRKGKIVDAQFGEGTDEGTREEVKVLEDSQNCEIQDERKDKPFLPVWRRPTGGDLLSNQKIHSRAANHEREETPIPPAVEKIAGQEKENILSVVIEVLV